MLHPALDVRGIDGELALAGVDDYSPTALEERDGFVTIFFADARQRDGAREALARAWPTASVVARDVDDEDWARRSQQNLAPVTVGRLTILPSLTHLFSTGAGAPTSHPVSFPVHHLSTGAGAPPALSALLPSCLPALNIVIQPSMGFGTGHHASTRLCLVALQTLDLTGRSVVDVGTGSGILAIAASRLGAREALGIDSDPDAVQAAIENLQFNEDTGTVTFKVQDLASATLPRADVVTANLTGALLRRSASPLLDLLRPSGALIVSGLQAEEREEVAAAFAAAKQVWEGGEDGWVGLMFRARPFAP